MRNTRLGSVLLYALVATSGCRAPSPDWNGTWKLNPTESNYQGQALTISISARGEYRFNEGNWSSTFFCDGKDQQLSNNRTRACVKTGGAGLEITLKENGVKTRVTHDELSTDGAAFKTTVTEFGPNGPVITSQIVFSRLSGSNGLAGQWRDTSYLQQHAEMTLRLDRQALYINYPIAGQQIHAPLDGTDAAVDGPHVPAGSTFAVRVAGKREFRTVTKRHGRFFNQGTLELSNDGRAITDSWWNPSEPADKGTLVYDKK